MTCPNIQKEIQQASSDLELQGIADRMLELKDCSKEEVCKVLKSKNEMYEDVSLKYFRLVNFSKLDLVSAYRKLATYTFINGDSQDVDLLHKRFCIIYSEQNPNTYAPEQCHILVTAFVLLNSDLHLKAVQKKMTVQQFISNIEKTCEGGRFSRETLTKIYNSVKRKQIKHKSQVDRGQKRLAITDIKSISCAKKSKGEDTHVRNFGFEIVKMKSKKNPSRKLLENITWRTYFISVDNLMLSFYKIEDFQKFYSEVNILRDLETQISYKNILQFIDKHDPVFELSLHHAIAMQDLDNMRICKLTLIDESKYLLKVKKKEHSCRLLYMINFAAGLLSKLPFLGMQSDNSTKHIIKYNWSAELSDLDFTAQEEGTKKQMKYFQEDLNYLNANVSKKGDYKSNLKYVEKNYHRYLVYCNTLFLAEGGSPDETESMEKRVDLNWSLSNSTESLSNGNANSGDEVN